MRKVFIVSGLMGVLALAALPIQGAEASTHHSKPDITHKVPQPPKTAVGNVAQAGEDLVNVVINVARTTTRPLRCMLSGGC